MLEPCQAMPRFGSLTWTCCQHMCPNPSCSLHMNWKSSSILQCKSEWLRYQCVGLCTALAPSVTPATQMQRALKLRAAAATAFIQKHSPDSSHDQAMELYRWGISLVQSRALTFRGRKYLCPGADMFNFEPRNDRREANAGESFLRYHHLTMESLQIYADRDCVAGI